MNRRNGTTLTEVLVAIFIMGIGLMAILSLFPLGAAQMAQALKDQRAAEAAANATSLARVIWKQACQADTDMYGAQTNTRPAFRQVASGKYYPRAVQRFIDAMDDPLFNDKANQPPDYPNSYPGTPVNIPMNPATLPPDFRLPPSVPVIPDAGGVSNYMMPMPVSGPDADRSSYPVFVDMFGWQSATSAQQRFWVGGNNPIPQSVIVNGTPTTKVGLIPRRPLYVRNPAAGVSLTSDWVALGDGSLPWNNLQRVFKQFSLMDDMSFNFDGTPDRDNDPSTSGASETGTTLQRQGRYSWAYMFQRVRNQSARTQVAVSIVVYSGRSLDVPTDEISYLGYPPSQPGSILSGSRQVQLQYTGTKPALRRGLWLLDASVFDQNGSINPQGRFYRVVNAEDGGTGILNIELQTPLATGPNTTPRVFVVMSNVVEVFQVGEMSPTSLPRNILDDQEY